MQRSSGSRSHAGKSAWGGLSGLGPHAHPEMPTAPACRLAQAHRPCCPCSASWEFQCSGVLPSPRLQDLWRRVGTEVSATHGSPDSLYLSHLGDISVSLFLPISHFPPLPSAFPTKPCKSPLKQEVLLESGSEILRALRRQPFLLDNSTAVKRKTKFQLILQ